MQKAITALNICGDEEGEGGRGNKFQLRPQKYTWCVQ